MEKVLIHSITIHLPGEVHPFRINLPRDLKVITGIMVTENTAISTVDPNTNPDKSSRINDNILIGRLYLKSRGYSNKFFSTEVIRNDNSLRYGDFAKLDFYQLPEATLEDFYSSDWFTAGAKWEYHPAEIKTCSNLMLGFFKDSFIENTGGKFDTYSITIYLKYETK